MKTLIKQVIRDIKWFLRITLQFKKCAYCDKRIIGHTWMRHIDKDRNYHLHYNYKDHNKGTCWSRWEKNNRKSRNNTGDS